MIVGNNNNTANKWKWGIILVGILLVMFFVFNSVSTTPQRYSEYVAALNADEVKSAQLGDTSIRYTLKSKPGLFETNIPVMTNQEEADKLTSKKIPVSIEESRIIPNAGLGGLILTLLLVGGLWYVLARQRGGDGAGGMGNMMKRTSMQNARISDPDTNTVRLADVAGCEEAKKEVTTFISFLRNPEKYEALGAKIPRGVLMSGNPGVGKTLMAKAIAGEAGVPFFAASGSDFVEMFVGMGAARIRNLIAEAAKFPVSVVFIDEFDALGKARSTNGSGGSDEREQTLNQLLVEMDGITNHNGGGKPPVIIFLAATNRPDMLDPALKRPGRFDREVHMPMPDVRARREILNVYGRKYPLSGDIDLDVVANMTSGYSGSDLANLLNEAAILAAEAGDNLITMKTINEAADKKTMGLARPTIMSKEEKSATAYHEAGHALISYVLKNRDPVYKVSIVPRSGALGVTVNLPERDHFSIDTKQLRLLMAMLYGGRVAEDKFVGTITTGASSDYERATSIAEQLISRYGMTSLGHRVITDMTKVSEQTAREIDLAILALTNAEYARAERILLENAHAMHRLHDELMAKETLDREAFENIMRECGVVQEDTSDLAGYVQIEQKAVSVDVVSVD